MGGIEPLWQAKTGNPKKMFVDLQNDVAASDVALAAQENFRSVEHLKRYTTMGMATDQGKLGNINAIAIRFQLDYNQMISTWADWATAQTDSWNDITDPNSWDWHSALT